MMVNMFFNSSDDFDKYVRDHSVERLGKGSYGTCYKMDTGVTLKCFHIGFSPKDVLKFKDVYIPGFQFARKIAAVRSSALGAFAEYGEGKDLKKRNAKDQDMILLGNHIAEFADNVRELSKLKIKMSDVARRNILYDYSKFTAIDTMDYSVQKDEDVLAYNIEEAMTVLMHHFVYEITRHSIMYDFRDYDSEENYMNPIGYFTEMRDYIRNDIAVHISLN